MGKIRSFQKTGKSEPYARDAMEVLCTETNMTEDVSVGSYQLIEKLNSYDPKVREEACIALANISAGVDESVVKELVEMGCFKKLLERVTDAEIHIQVFALIAISNLCQHSAEFESINFINMFMEMDILLILTGVMGDRVSQIKNPSLTADSTDINRYTTFVEAGFDVLYSMAESGDQNVICKLAGPEFLSLACVCLDGDKFSQSTLLSSLSFLYVLSDDNEIVCQTLQGDQYFCKAFQDLFGNTQFYPEMKALMIGIYNNMISVLNLVNVETEIQTIIIPTLQSLLDLDVNGQYIDNMRPAIIKVREEAKKESEIDYEGNSGFKGRYRYWNSDAKAIRTTLEILANIYITRGNSELKEDSGDEWVSDEEEGANAEETKANPSTTEVASPLAVDQFMSPNVLKRIFDTAKPMSAAMREDISNFRVVDHFKFPINGVTYAALSCINNLLINHPARLFALNGFDITSMWVEIKNILSYICELQAEFKTTEIVEMAFGIVWALLRYNKDWEAGLTIDDAEIRILVEMVNFFDQNAFTDEGKRNYLGMIGALGRFINEKEVNSMVGKQLVDACKDQNLLIVTQALDAMFDVYSEENHDDVFVHLGILTLLKEGYPLLKQKAKSLKKMFDPEEFGTIKDAINNLKRFIEYKEKHIPSG